MPAYGFIPPYTNCPAHGAGTLIVWPLGDSITQGINGGWKAPLFTAVTSIRPDSDFKGAIINAQLTPPVTNCGTGSNGNPNSAAWQWHANGWVNQFMPNPRPHIVLLSLGANDSDNTQGGVDVGNCIDDIIALAPNANILVANRTPQSAVGSSNINAEIASQVATRKAAGKHVQLVDAFNSIKVSDLSDGLHPTERGYQLMGELWTLAVCPLVIP